MNTHKRLAEEKSSPPLFPSAPLRALCSGALILLGALSAPAQFSYPDYGFRRSSDSNAYPHVLTLSSNDVFLIHLAASDTNANYPGSNLWANVTNIAAYQALLATNSNLALMTNIAAYQAFLATNGWTANATNIAAYQAFLATNGWTATATNIAAYQAWLSTNGWTEIATNIAAFQGYLATNNYAGTAINIASNQAWLATNGYAPIVTQIVQYIFVTTGIVSNQFTTNLLWAALPSVGATNYVIPAGPPYRNITATGHIAFTNVSAFVAASVEIIPNGATRLMFFPTNWKWLSTNDGTYNFALSGSQYMVGVTNGVAKGAWLSVAASGDDPTNVTALVRVTP